jgi:hypothetical protein
MKRAERKQAETSAHAAALRRSLRDFPLLRCFPLPDLCLASTFSHPLGGIDLANLYIRPLAACRYIRDLAMLQGLQMSPWGHAKHATKPYGRDIRSCMMVVQHGEKARARISTHGAMHIHAICIPYTDACFIIDCASASKVWGMVRGLSTCSETCHSGEDALPYQASFATARNQGSHDGTWLGDDREFERIYFHRAGVTFSLATRSSATIAGCAKSCAEVGRRYMYWITNTNATSLSQSLSTIFWHSLHGCTQGSALHKYFHVFLEQIRRTSML